MASGLPGQLLGAAAVTGMAPGTRIGDFGDPLPVEGFELDFGDAPPTGCESSRSGPTRPGSAAC